MVSILRPTINLCPDKNWNRSSECVSVNLPLKRTEDEIILTWVKKHNTHLRKHQLLNARHILRKNSPAVCNKEIPFVFGDS